MKTEIREEIKSIIDELSIDCKKERLVDLFDSMEPVHETSEPAADSVMPLLKNEINIMRSGNRPGRLKGLLQKNKYKAGTFFAAAAVVIFVITIFIGKNEHYAQAGKITGDVTVETGKTAVKVFEGMKISAGAVLKTGKKSSVELVFSSGTDARISADTDTLLKIFRTEPDRTSLQFHINKGVVFLKSSKIRKNDVLSISTPDAIAFMRGTTFSASFDEIKRSRFEVYEGRVKVRGVIDSEDYFADSRDRDDIEKQLEAESVIVEQNSICIMKSNDENYSADPKGAKKTRKRLEPLVVSSNSDQFIYSAEASAFIKNEPVLNKKNENKIDAVKRAVSSTISSNSREDAPFVLYENYGKKQLLVGDSGNIRAGSSEKPFWTAMTGPPAALPVLHRGILFINSTDGYIYALSVDTGRILWRKFIPGGMPQNINLAADSNSIFVTDSNNGILHLDLNGNLVWRAVFSGPVLATPVISRGFVFLPVSGGEVYGLEIEKGIKVIRIPAGADVKKLLIFRNLVYSATATGTIICYNYSSGEVVWKKETGAGFSDFSADRNGVYAINRSGRISSFNHSGIHLYSKETGVKPARPMIIFKGSLYISSENNLMTVDSATGDVSWSVVIQKIISRNIDVTGDEIHFVSAKSGLETLRR